MFAAVIFSVLCPALWADTTYRCDLDVFKSTDYSQVYPCFTGGRVPLPQGGGKIHGGHGRIWLCYKQGWTGGHDDTLTRKWSLHYWPFVWGIHWWPVDSPHKGPIMWNFQYFFVVSLSKLLNRQWSCRWSEVSWYSCYVIIMHNNIYWTWWTP